MSVWIEFLTPFILLSLASIDDLYSKKIHNYLLIALLPVVLLGVFLSKGLLGLQMGLLLAFIIFVLGVPLHLIRLLGGGDLKLLTLLAFCLHWQIFIYSLAYSMVWASLLGLFKIILDGEIKDFLWNIFFIFRFRNLQKEQLHTIPFAICLLFGWLSHFSLTGGFRALF